MKKLTLFLLTLFWALQTVNAQNKDVKTQVQQPQYVFTIVEVTPMSTQPLFTSVESGLLTILTVYAKR